MTSRSQLGVPLVALNVMVSVWTRLTTWTSALDHEYPAAVRLRDIRPSLALLSLDTEHSLFTGAKVCLCKR